MTTPTYKRFTDYDRATSVSSGALLLLSQGGQTKSVTVDTFLSGTFAGSQGERRFFVDTNIRTLTNVAKTQIGADLYTLPASYFVSSATKLRIRVWGEPPAAVTSIGIDFYHPSSTRQMDYRPFIGTANAIGFDYTFELYPSAAAAQRVMAVAMNYDNNPSLFNSGKTADMTLPQVVRLMGQSASGTITVRGIEMWVTG